MTEKNTALLVVDMQKDVLKYLVKNADIVLPQIKKTIELCRKKNIPVIYLVREHRASGVDVEVFREQKFKDQPFLVIGSEGAEVLDEIKPLPNESIVNKKRFSGFFQSDLLMILTRLKINSVVICGVQTPNCIRGTATDALSYDFDVTLLEDAITAQTQGIHQANLLDMKNMGAHLLSTDDFLATL